MPHLKLAWVFVIMMVVVSAAMNFSFGWRLGEHSYTVTSHIHDGWIYGILSLAGDGFKIVMGVLTLTFFLAHTMPIGLRALGFLACGVLFVCATAYSLNSAIGSISMNRTDMAGVREAKATNYDAVKSQLDRVQKEQSWLDQGYRASAAVDADLAGLRQSSLWSRTAGCTDATVTESRSFCQRYTALQAELGTARRAEDLDGKADALRKQLAGMGGAVIADPHAKMLNQLTGYDQPTIVLAWLLLVVALVEGGSTIGPIALSMAHRAIQSREEARTAAKASDPISVAPAPVTAVLRDPPAIPVRFERKPNTPMIELPEFKAAESAERVAESSPDPDGPGTPIAKPEEPKIEEVADISNVVPLKGYHDSGADWRIEKDVPEKRSKKRAQETSVSRWLRGFDVRDLTPEEVKAGKGFFAKSYLKQYEAWCRAHKENPFKLKKFSAVLRGELDQPKKRRAGGQRFNVALEPVMAQARMRVA